MDHAKKKFKTSQIKNIINYKFDSVPIIQTHYRLLQTDILSLLLSNKNSNLK